MSPGLFGDGTSLLEELDPKGLGDRRIRRRGADGAVEERLAPHAGDVLAATALGDLEAGEADDVVPATVALAARRVPDRDGHGDLIVDVVRAVGADLVALQAADPVKPGDPDLGAAAVAVGRRSDLTIEKRPAVRAVGCPVLAQAIPVAPELEPAEAAR